MSDRTAPIDGWRSNVPWSVHERAWRRYAALGHGDQSAERVAERGGFGWAELCVLLTGGDPWNPPSRGGMWAHISESTDPKGDTR